MRSTLPITSFHLVHVTLDIPEAYRRTQSSRPPKNTFVVYIAKPSEVRFQERDSNGKEEAA